MKTIKHSLLLAAMTLLPVWTIAQEKTWEVVSHGDESSLIREVPSGRWLVYNHNSGISYFSQVSSAGNVASMFQLGYNAGANYTVIHDFELFKDTVYFCGQTGTMEKRRSIWGYFPLTNFPQVDVYVREADFDNLKKLEVFTVDSTMKEVHVVMLGEKDEKETVVDEMRIAPNQFNESFSEIFSPGVQFNDIAVTDSHIVVIAETKPIIISTKIVFIERPSTVGMPIFNSNIRFRERSKLTTHAGNELLKTCDGYFCVHAYLDSRDGIVVTAYNGKSYHSSVNIPVNENRPPKLTSICYGKAFRNLEILTRPFFERRSVIYSLYPALSGYGGAVYMHKYWAEELASLDWLSNDSEHVVASGHNDTISMLRIYKYKYYQWGSCTTRDVVECFPYYKDLGSEEITPPYENRNIFLEKLHTFTLEKPTKKVCE